MELIFELIFEIIVDGSMNAVSDKKIPLILRILAAIVLLIVYGGIVGLCLFWGMHNKSVALIIIGLGVLVLFGLGLLKTYKRHRR